MNAFNVPYTDDADKSQKIHTTHTWGRPIIDLLIDTYINHGERVGPLKLYNTAYMYGWLSRV